MVQLKSQRLSLQKIMTFRFNSCMVQLKLSEGDIMRIYTARFNSCMVQLKLVSCRQRK